MRDWLIDLFNKKLRDKKFNLIILGAQKCGTSSLHEALLRHPEIFMCNPIKEPGYFLPFEVMKKYYHKKGVDIKYPKYYLYNYLLRNYENEKYIGEASTFYTTLEWSSSELASKIRSYNPEMKLIYLYRNKADRIVSHFYHELKKNAALSFDDFLDQPEAFGISNYYQRIKPYVEVFNRKNILFLRFEDLINDHAKELIKICNFLNIDNSYELKEYPKKNQKNVISDHNSGELKAKVLEHKNYLEQVEDDKLFMHLTQA